MCQLIHFVTTLLAIKRITFSISVLRKIDQKGYTEIECSFFSID